MDPLRHMSVALHHTLRQGQQIRNTKILGRTLTFTRPVAICSILAFTLHVPVRRESRYQKLPARRPKTGLARSPRLACTRLLLTSPPPRIPSQFNSGTTSTAHLGTPCATICPKIAG